MPQPEHPIPNQRAILPIGLDIMKRASLLQASFPPWPVGGEAAIVIPTGKTTMSAFNGIKVQETLSSQFVLHVGEVDSHAGQADGQTVIIGQPPPPQTPWRAGGNK